jgi:hypothetical protein
MKRLISLALVLQLVLLTAVGRGEECSADPAWFNSSGEPDATQPDAHQAMPKDTDECVFYKRAWQNFLYITHPEGSAKARFLTYTAPTDLFHAPVANAAHFALKGRKPGTLNMLPRTGKTEKGAINSVTEASSLGLLVDQQGRAVYFAMQLNPTFVEFIKKNGFDTDVKKIGTWAHDSGDKPVEPGSMEIKSSWKILGPGDDPKRFFCVDQDIPKLKTVTDPMTGLKKIVPSEDPIRATLGLVGLHIVDTVDAHPEFIWATFEHIDNAPGLAGDGIKPEDAVDGTRDYTFYSLGTKRSECNVNAKATMALDEATQVLTPSTQVMRQFRYGNPDDSGVNRPDEDVATLNRDVHARLKAADSVWQYYHLVGVVWINDKNDFKSNDDPIDDAVLKGEIRLSNSTIETFTQHDKSPPPLSRPNCFRCHTANSEAKGTLMLPPQQINVSHVLKSEFFKQ